MGYITEQELDNSFLEKISYVGNRTYLTGVYNINSWNFPRATGEFVEDNTFNKTVLKVSLTDPSNLPCGGYILSKNVCNNLILENEICTWSVWLRSDNEIKLKVGHERSGLNTVTVTSKWKRFDFTYTVKSNNQDYKAFIFYILEKGIPKNSIYIHEPKLEKGYIVTDYNLAIEDIATKDDINKLNNSDDLLKPIKKEIDSLKSYVDNGKNSLYSAIVGKKVTPKSKDFDSLVQGVKDIPIENLEQNKKYESQIQQLNNEKSQLQNQIKSIKPAKGNAQINDVIEGKTFTNDSGNILTGTVSNNGNKVITPSKSLQELGTGFYNNIKINPITPELVKTNITNQQLNQIIKDKEPNLKPENIKRGVSIGGVIGNYMVSLKTISIDKEITKDTKSIDLDINGIIVGFDLRAYIDNRFGSGLDSGSCSYNILESKFNTSYSSRRHIGCNRGRSNIYIYSTDTSIMLDTSDSFQQIKGDIYYIE